MRRWGLLFIVFLLLSLPVVLIVIQHWDTITHGYTMLKASKRKLGSNYSVVNTVPGYTVTLADTAYLDYITSRLTIFSPNGVIDPAANSGHREVTTRYTVNAIRIELVPALDRYILGVSGNDFFAGYGTYLVDGDTLVVKIALNFNDSMLYASAHGTEEVFLDVLYQTLYFAHGVTYAADLYSGSTITWRLGYTNGTAWWQTKGGDVSAASALRSYVPASASPRYAVLDGSSGTPGVATYGTTYDFDSDPWGTGGAYVSSKGWLANEPAPLKDYYAVMQHRFGFPAADYTGDTTFTSKLASRAAAYYVNGNLTIDTTDWSVTDGETIIVLVSGNLTINRKINLAGTGFLAFIVKGNITVSPTVGVPYTSSEPVVEGVYMTSPAGTFSSGASTSAGRVLFNKLFSSKF